MEIRFLNTLNNEWGLNSFNFLPSIVYYTNPKSLEFSWLMFCLDIYFDNEEE